MQPGHERIEVRLDQPILAFVLLAEQLRDHFGFDTEQLGQHADVHDVLQQLALFGVDVLASRDIGQRNADQVDVGAQLRRRDRLGAVVHQIAARLDLRDVFLPRLRIHRDHQIDAATAAKVAVLGHPHLVPRRQALNVGRKNIARRHRNAHAQNAAREQFVRRRRS